MHSRIALWKLVIEGPGVVNGSVLRGWLSHNEARCDTISACPARVVSAGPPLSTSLAIPNSITDYVMNIPLMFA